MQAIVALKTSSKASFVLIGFSWPLIPPFEASWHRITIECVRGNDLHRLQTYRYSAADVKRKLTRALDKTQLTSPSILVAWKINPVVNYYCTTTQSLDLLECIKF